MANPIMIRCLTFLLLSTALFPLLAQEAGETVRIQVRWSNGLVQLS